MEGAIMTIDGFLTLNPAARRLGGAIRWDVEVLKALMAEQAKNRDD